MPVLTLPRLMADFAATLETLDPDHIAAIADFADAVMALRDRELRTQIAALPPGPQTAMGQPSVFLADVLALIAPSLETTT